jgi:hypothetical protein
LLVYPTTCTLKLELQLLAQLCWLIWLNATTKVHGIVPNIQLNNVQTHCLWIWCKKYNNFTVIRNNHNSSFSLLLVGTKYPLSVMTNATTEKKIRPSTKESLLLPTNSSEKPLIIVTSDNNEDAIPMLRSKREVSEFSSLRKFIVEQKQLYPVFLINKYVQYYQNVPISEIYSEISGLSIQIGNLSPSGPDNFTVLPGVKNTYWISKHPFIGGLGTVACASINTAQVDLFTLQQEKLQVQEPVIPVMIA